MRLSPEDIVLLKRLAREGVVELDAVSDHGAAAEALEESGLVRAAGRLNGGGARRYVLSGLGVQTARDVTNVPPYPTA